MSEVPDIQQLADDGRRDLEGATSLEELDDARVRHLGRSAPLVLLLRRIPELEPAQRGIVGREGNQARQMLEGVLATARERLEAQQLERELTQSRVDVTLPARSMPQGTLHPMTTVRRRIEDIFLGMGYDIADGPEIESEFYNFTALNTPEGHPARSTSDTFYLSMPDVPEPAHPLQGNGGVRSDKVLLRTHTSPVQARVMQQNRPPVYVVAPGSVYRRDRVDATHGDLFHQVELLAVDYGLTLAHLKGTIATFLRELFGADVKTRMRTHFFPFTEPSVEVDMTCFVCAGTGAPDEAAQSAGLDRCRVCRGAGWIEMGGAGMVDPAVFAHFDGYDTEGLSGFAFGFGIDRIVMLRHALPDLRLLLGNDLRFLSQFPGR